MKKRVLFFVLVTILLTSIAAKAALPALVLPVIAEAVEALVIRSAGRQIVTSLSTAAANDTTFAAAVAAVRGTQVAAWLGFGAVTAAFPGNADAPVSPTLAKERYAVAVGPIGMTVDYKPTFISPGYKMDSPEYGKFVYGKTREEAAAAVMVALKASAEWVSTYGNPVSWRPYRSYAGQTNWNEPGRSYWTIEIYTDGYYNDINQSGQQRYIYPAEPVEPRDGQRRILYNGKAFQADTEDPDWSSQDVADFGEQTAIGFVGKGANNDPLRVGLVSQGANIRVTEDVQGLSPDGKPQVVTRVLDISPGTGQATSTSSGTQVGTTLETKPADWSSSSPSGSTSSAGWPDDYARELTVKRVANAAESSADSLTKLSDELTKKKDAADPEFTDTSSLKDKLIFKDVFKNVLSWKLPPHTSECPVIQWKAEIAGFDLSPRIDKHCDLIDQNLRSTINTAFGVLYLAIAFFILMGA